MPITDLSPDTGAIHTDGAELFIARVHELAAQAGGEFQSTHPNYSPRFIGFVAGETSLNMLGIQTARQSEDTPLTTSEI